MSKYKYFLVMDIDGGLVDRLQYPIDTPIKNVESDVTGKYQRPFIIEEERQDENQ